MRSETSNRRYELIVVLIFFFTWGFVFLDRLSISFLLPTIQQEIGLTNTDIGYIGFVTSGCYAVSAIVFGVLSDRWGYKKRVLIPFVLGTAIFSSLGVFTHTLPQLIVVRALVGLCEGPIAPLIYSIVAINSGKQTLGRNVGILNAAVNLIAVTFGPILITQLVAHFTWQHTFLLSSLPTFVMLIFIALFIKEIRVQPEEDQKKASLMDVFKYRNIKVSLVVNILAMCVYWTFLLFAPLYLVNVGNLPVQTMGWIASFMGLLCVVYSVLVPKLSDNFGRKPLIFTCLALATITPFFMFLLPGSKISIVMYVVFGGILGPSCPIFQNIIPMESVPNHLKATATALVLSFGDFLGSACYPVLAGKVADSTGLPVMMLIAAIIAVAALLFSFFYTETHPRKLETSANANAAK